MTEFNPGSAADLNEAVKLRYEANPDTNAFTDAEKAKLAGVASGATAYSHPDHTGDVTSSGDGATTIAEGAVSYAKMQDVSAASRLIGRGDSGAGDPQEITLGTGLTMTGTVLSAAGGGGGLSDAPSDGWPYIRKDAAWVVAPEFISTTKPADEGRSSNTTLAYDSDLAGISLQPNSIYRLEMMLITKAASSPDIKFALSRQTGLSDAVLRFAGDLDSNAAVIQTWDSVELIPGVGPSIERLGNWLGTIATGSQGGTFGLIWAQNSAGSNPSVLVKTSGIYLRRVG